MGTDRHGASSSGAELRERQQELLRSLRAAVETLSLCVERIEDMISRIDRQTSSPPEPSPARPPAQVSFGGGASVIGAAEPDSLFGARDGLTGARDGLTGARDGLTGARDGLTGARDGVTGARVLDAGGSLGFRESLIGSDERRRASDRRADRAERRTERGERRSDRGERRTDRGEPRTSLQGDGPGPGTPALMMATELAHQGYSREEIAERLRARWGERAAAILRAALD